MRSSRVRRRLMQRGRLRRFRRDLGGGARRRSRATARRAAPRPRGGGAEDRRAPPTARTRSPIFAREIYPAATAMAQGLTGFAGGRPEPQPVIRLFSFLADKAGIPITVELDGNALRRFQCFLPNERLARACASRALLRRATACLRRAPALCTRSPADRPGAWPQRRQGRHRQYRRAGAPARISRRAARAAHGRGGPQLSSRISPKARSSASNGPGLDGFNFMLHEGLGGGGIASLTPRPARQGDGADPDGLCRSRCPPRWLRAGSLLAGWDEAKRSHAMMKHVAAAERAMRLDRARSARC